MKKIKNSVDWKHKGWDEFFNEVGNSWRAKDYHYLDSIFDISQFKGTLLDMGCALGDGIVYLKNKCPEVKKFYGADFSSNAIKTCQSTFKSKDVIFFRHDIMNPLPGNYDIIICLQTLEHLLNPKKAIKNLIEATNCLLIVSVPYKNRRPDINHLWSFDKKDFKDLMNKYRLGQYNTNIYWMLYKQNSAYSFRRRSIKFFIAQYINRIKPLGDLLIK